MPDKCEYDKPILDNIEKPEVAIEMREGLKNLYSVLKGADADLPAQAPARTSDIPARALVPANRCGAALDVRSVQCPDQIRLQGMRGTDHRRPRYAPCRLDRDPQRKASQFKYGNSALSDRDSHPTIVVRLRAHERADSQRTRTSICGILVSTPARRMPKQIPGGRRWDARREWRL